MQDFTPLGLNQPTSKLVTTPLAKGMDPVCVAVVPPAAMAIARRLTDEQFMASPIDMYLYALALRGKLPDHLHHAMIMWSFDPKQNEHVQAYLTWIDSCEERKAAKERWEKSFARNERIMIVVAVALSILAGIAALQKIG
jgi:hypothetical protein